MANLNLGQDAANKRERKLTATHKTYPLQLTVKMHRYGSLIKINLSGRDEKKVSSVM